VRTYAARYLADLGVGEAGPAITRLLSASDARARSAAIKALARLQYEDVTGTLIELASNDESPVVRSHAIGALGRTGSDERIERTLIDALSDPDPAVSWCAAHRLASIGGATAIGPLLAAAERAHPLRRRAYRKAVRQIRKRSGSAGSH
jgi:HEAT repeat protein